ncbi:alpha/beta fold hydrolase [Amycolatopsis magusensis]|uniref:alpha/beta fold hydrolase n=1 Tax=Amycolatopsis magusensis TaxID=882444 RepID=UPI0034D6DF33
MHPRRALAALAATLLVLTACDPAPEPVAEHEAATRGDTEFTERFRHEFADVDGVRLHYVTGGHGPALVLLHGWPQTWYSWRGIMPALAEHFTVYALDLPGLGDSTGAPPSYDKATLARYLHTLVAHRLGIRDARIAGHDLGAAVAFQYAAQFPDDVDRLAYLDLPLPGPARRRRVPRAELAHRVPLPAAGPRGRRRRRRPRLPRAVLPPGRVRRHGFRRLWSGSAVRRRRGRRIRPHLCPARSAPRRLRAVSHAGPGRPRQHRGRADQHPDPADDRARPAGTHAGHGGTPDRHDLPCRRGPRRRALAGRGEPAVRHRRIGRLPGAGLLNGHRSQ